MRAIASLALLVSLMPLRGQTTPPKSAPWQDLGVRTAERDGARHWCATASERGKTEAEAKQAAESEARRMLASSATTQIKQDLVSKQRERTVDGKTRSEDDFSSDLRAVTDHMVNGARAVRPLRSRGPGGWADTSALTSNSTSCICAPDTRARLIATHLHAAQGRRGCGLWPWAPARCRSTP